MNKCLTEECKAAGTCADCAKCWFHCNSDFYCIRRAYRQPSDPLPTASTEGVKHDQEKDRYDLLPAQSIHEVVKVLTFGAGKYGDRNWERGMNWSRLFGALNRHMWAWFSRQGTDSETKISHLAHAACCALMLLEYELRGTGKDDRPYGEVQ